MCVCVCVCVCVYCCLCVLPFGPPYYVIAGLGKVCVCACVHTCKHDTARLEGRKGLTTERKHAFSFFL